MATYIVLTSFTDQGIRSAKDTTKRSDAVKELAKKFGVTAKEFYWTLGSYDVVGIFDARDDASMTALGLAIGAGGNIRTQTLRAFSREEMNGVLAKLAEDRNAPPQVRPGRRNILGLNAKARENARKVET